MNNLLISGYRAHELSIFDQKHKGIPYIKKAIEKKLIPLLEDGLQWVITPGQYGVDLWACEVVLALKADYPQVKLSILTAYLNPEEKWKEEKKTYYQQIVQAVDYYGTTSKQPYLGVSQLKVRDDVLFAKTEGLILVYDDDAAEASPRFYKQRALKKQQSEGYQLISIGSEDIQSVAEDEQWHEQSNQGEQGDQQWN